MVLGVAFCAHELKNAGAKKVVAVMPYFGYSRQECSDISGKPGSAQVIAKMLQEAGIDELVAVELHDEKLVDLFSIPVHNLSVDKIIAKHIKEQRMILDSVCLVAPDQGAAAYVEAIAKQVGMGTLTFSKERFAVDQTRVTGIVGVCEGSIGIIIDDIIATGGTALNVCNALPDSGYKTIYGYFVHPVLAGNAVERIADSCFDTVFVGNTLPLTPEAKAEQKIKQFDVSDVIVDKLRKIVG